MGILNSRQVTPDAVVRGAMCSDRDAMLDQLMGTTRDRAFDLEDGVDALLGDRGRSRGPSLASMHRHGQGTKRREREERQAERAAGSSSSWADPYALQRSPPPATPAAPTGKRQRSEDPAEGDRWERQSQVDLLLALVPERLFRVTHTGPAPRDCGGTRQLVRRALDRNGGPRGQKLAALRTCLVAWRAFLPKIDPAIRRDHAMGRTSHLRAEDLFPIAAEDAAAFVAAEVDAHGPARESTRLRALETGQELGLDIHLDW